jgi:hypothetical protein
MAVDDAPDLRRELLGRREDMRQQRPTCQAMQDFRRARVHALARTRGENDDIHKKQCEFSRMRDVSTASPIKTIAGAKCV